MMKKIILLLLLAVAIPIYFYGILVQAVEETSMTAETFSGLKLRNIGPAFMSGRIADIDIDSKDKSIWYVGVGSGGVWKTINAGTTWQPIFDKQKVYSIGAVTIDPSDSNIIWVGTGENVGGRHASFGDGAYISYDGGENWENKGLNNSEHISEIIVHPKDSNIVWIASQGPLWSKGGDRGLYKTVDGGKNWKRVLGDSEWVGVTDIVIDPRNPDRLYAATWQRHRTVAALVDSGPGTGLYKSVDGGETWQLMKNGLPTISATDKGEGGQKKAESKIVASHMGKIGLAISPINPDILYAAIELGRRTGAVYRSSNRGATWEKRSDTVAGGTGPHYYQELYASPHKLDQLFLANVRMLQSDDGGKTFKPMEEKHKHSDNHALSFVTDDKDYMLMGSDGGIYESFDSGANWRFISNLPVTQFYKLAVDDAVPFYNIYGGTQDNNTQGGPSRTNNVHGIRNTDWEVILFGDGHQPATEPGNPDIVYAEWQRGNLVRADRTTGEIVYIQPQPEPGDAEQRFNWDAPILVSPHKPTRLYFASQRLWRSEDRGDSWIAISGDLTRNLERMEQPIMGGHPSWDAAWDMYAMSDYSTITSLAESPLQEDLIYVGTDDGLVQVTENGGENWRKINVKSLPGVPASAFVNDIKADLFDVNTVYIALDNHKFGDYKPYLLKSTNRGKSWASIAGDLPNKHLVWRLVQDHIKANLLFVGTEFGVFLTTDGGKHWIELNGGVPTISFRDLAIQRRENDLVGATFGRGFFVLDDYSPLREVTENLLKQEATLFPTRKAWWYIEQGPLGPFSEKGSMGASYYTAPNPPFGAVFTYYLKEELKTKQTQRRQEEKKLQEKNSVIAFPGWDAVEAERREAQPHVWLTIKNSDDSVVRRISGTTNKGFNRVAWNLELPDTEAITTVEEETDNGYFQTRLLAAPGEYSVVLSKEVNGKITVLQGPQKFQVERMTKGALTGAAPEVVGEFWRRISAVKRDLTATEHLLVQAQQRAKMLKRALRESTSEPGALDGELESIRQVLLDIDHNLNDNRSKTQIYSSNKRTVNARLFVATMGTARSTYGPTPTHRRSLELAEQQLSQEKDKLKQLLEQRLPALEKKLEASGAPWVVGQSLP